MCKAVSAAAGAEHARHLLPFKEQLAAIDTALATPLVETLTGLQGTADLESPLHHWLQLSLIPSGKNPVCLPSSSACYLAWSLVCPTAHANFSIQICSFPPLTSSGHDSCPVFRMAVAQFCAQCRGLLAAFRIITLLADARLI